MNAPNPVQSSRDVPSSSLRDAQPSPRDVLPSPPSPSWWRLPIMWLVVSGPLVVVLAGVVTMWLAIDGADATLANVPNARDVARGGVKERGDAPAQQARNHAATPVQGKVEGPFDNGQHRPVAPAGSRPP